MKARVAQACLCGLLIFLAMWRSATADGPDPTSAYEKRSVQEFTILVNRRVLEHKKDGAAALKEVNAQLEKIARVVSPRRRRLPTSTGGRGRPTRRRTTRSISPSSPRRTSAKTTSFPSIAWI